MTPRVLAALIYCGAAFGGSFLFMRIAAPDIPALLVAFGRVGIATVLLTIVAGPSTLRTLARSWRDYVVLALFMSGGPFLLFAIAERSITAGMGSIINATSPIWVLIVGAVWAKQPITPRRIVGIAFGFGGVAVIVGTDALALAPDAWTGALTAVVAASLYGVGLNHIRRRMRDVRPIHLALGQLAASTILLAPFAIASLPDARFELDAVLAVVGIAVVSTTIAWPVLFTINHAVGPVATSTVTFLNPIFGVLWGGLFLAEAVSPTLLGGAALVFVSLVLVLDIGLPARFRPRTADGPG